MTFYGLGTGGRFKALQLEAGLQEVMRTIKLNTTTFDDVRFSKAVVSKLLVLLAHARYVGPRRDVQVTQVPEPRQGEFHAMCDALESSGDLTPKA